MIMHDDDRPRDDGVYQSATSARPGRRRRIVAGAVGLAAALGATGYLITSQVVGQDGTATSETGALAPVAPATDASSDGSPTASASASASGVASAPASAPASAAARTKRTTSPGPGKSTSASVEAEINAARAAAEDDGHPLQRARTAAPDAVTGPVDERDEPTANGVIRIVSAKHDLSGQREMLWSADDGVPVGNARCTQNFQLSNEAVPEKRPTMMLCWRTSAGKSVLTVEVAHKGKPSAAAGVAVLDREWAKLG